VSELLLDFGASDMTPDKDGKTPLDFKDKQNSKEMRFLLEV
jgi:ankyrin repeat protein